MSKTIGESVGVKGGVACSNRPEDQKVVLDLLNRIPEKFGGQLKPDGSGLAMSAFPRRPPDRRLVAAILRFQQEYHAPPYSLPIDGHVDPDEKTLMYLNLLADNPKLELEARVSATSSTYVRSIATISWIDPKAKLAVDDGTGPSRHPTRNFIRHSVGFRFSNYLEATVTVNGDGEITAFDFTKNSAQYLNHSFLGLDAVAFADQRKKVKNQDSVTFTQIVGSATKSPEKIGAGGGGIGGVVFAGIGGPSAVALAAMLGWGAGHKCGHPPIWTELQLKIFKDGRTEGKAIRWSLFPSMNFYVQEYGNAYVNLDQLSLKATPYDGVPNCAKWTQVGKGWGELKESSGPCEGNPWGIKKWL